MDSLTQAVLGGAVGHAVAGRRLGRRAAAWGAALGTVPDLDILAYPWLDTAGELIVHRGVTHGLAFAFVAGPAFGWLIARAERWRLRNRDTEPKGRRSHPGSWRAWTVVAFWALITHPILDWFTVYGTQLLAPFSRHPFAIGSVFIIDPLYTLPLLACLVVALVRRRPRWSVAGLAVSTLYLAWGVAAQQVVTARAEAALPDARRILVTPMPLQSLYWRVEAEREGRVETYTHALVRPGAFWPDGEPVALARLPPALEATRGVATLRWFSRGWLVEGEADGAPLEAGETVVADARFGRGGPAAPHVFRWAVGPDGALRTLPLEARLSGDALRDLGRGMRGLPPRAPAPDAPAADPGSADPAP